MLSLTNNLFLTALLGILCNVNFLTDAQQERFDTLKECEFYVLHKFYRDVVAGVENFDHRSNTAIKGWLIEKKRVIDQYNIILPEKYMTNLSHNLIHIKHISHEKTERCLTKLLKKAEQVRANCVLDKLAGYSLKSEDPMSIKKNLKDCVKNGFNDMYEQLDKFTFEIREFPSSWKPNLKSKF